MEELSERYKSAKRVRLAWLGSKSSSHGHGSAVLRATVSAVHAAECVLEAYLFEDSPVSDDLGPS